MSQHVDSVLTREDVEACPGLVDVLQTLDRHASLGRPFLIRGETSTARSLFSKLSPEKGSVLDIFCPLMPSEPGALLGVIEQYTKRLRQPGLVAFVEVDRVAADDQRLLAMIARDRVIDARRTPLVARLVCQFDPRYGSFVPLPGVFVEVDLPPLAARPDDAAVLFTRILTRLLGRPTRLDDLAVQAIVEYSWPGDVSELVGRAEQVVSRLLGGPPRSKIAAEDLGIPHVTAAQRRAKTQATEGRKLAAMMDEYEAEVIQIVMTRFAGNKSHVARELGISRSYLIQKCQKYGIE